ncbi:hypothetical protein [Pseudobutyrivibrio sp.]
MNYNDLFMAMNGIDDSVVVNTYSYAKNKINKSKIIFFRQRKSLTSAAAIAAIVVLLSSMTVYATWKYLTAQQIASGFSDQKLTDEFTNNNTMEGGETQSYNNYDITLLGIVSGQEISDYLQKDDQGFVDGDKTYVAIAISHTDGASMPDVTDASFDPEEFFISPYIEGLDPSIYNRLSMGENSRCFVEDGVQYRIIETTNIEAFADRDIYIGVSDGNSYNEDAFIYDAETGVISRNTSYEGINALFTLTIDTSKANQSNAEALIEKMENYEPGGEYIWVESDMDRWANSITIENINDLAVPDESSKKTMSADEFLDYLEYTYNDYDNAEAFVKEGIFDNKVGMTDMIERCEGYVETYTLNQDGTITVLRYVPKK